MVIRLTAKTHKAKNRIRERGDKWVVLTVTGQPDPNATAPGGGAFDPIRPMYLITPVPERNKRTRYMRWLLQNDDPDFDWELAKDV
jgi:hypothetical protein